MNKEQRKKKLRDLKDNAYGEAFADEIEEMIDKIRKEAVNNAEEIEEVHGAKIAIKYFKKLKKKIHRQAQKGDREDRQDLGIPSWE